jgi:hypothetical protein
MLSQLLQCMLVFVTINQEAGAYEINTPPETTKPNSAYHPTRKLENQT